MSKKTILLGLAAVALVLFISTGILGAENSVAALCLPFTWTAEGLRKLSLSGSLGNAVAIALLVVAGLLPLVLKWKKSWGPEDVLLVFTSIAIWYTLYVLINPYILPDILMGVVGETLLCGSCYSLFLSWAVLRLLRSTCTMTGENFMKALQIFLYLCAATQVFLIASRTSGLVTSWKLLESGNTMPGQNLLPSYLFLLGGFLVSVLEYGLNGWLLLLGARLMKDLSQDPYGEAACRKAESLYAWCRRTLAVVLLSQTALNVAAVIFASRIYYLVGVGFRLPVSSMALVFALLVLASLLRKGQQLQDDNRLFI